MSGFGLDGASAPGGIPWTFGNGLPNIDDVAFAVLALRLERMDTDIATRIKDMHGRLEVRRAYQGRIDELRTTIAQSGVTESDEMIYDIPGRCRQYDYTLDENGKVVKNDIGYFDTDNGKNTTKARVEAEIERLQGRIEQLNGDTEIEMMRLNQLVNQRSTALEMTTNLLKSNHDSQMAIVRNIG